MNDKRNKNQHQTSFCFFSLSLSFSLYVQSNKWTNQILINKKKVKVKSLLGVYLNLFKSLNISSTFFFIQISLGSEKGFFEKAFINSVKQFEGRSLSLAFEMYKLGQCRIYLLFKKITLFFSNVLFCVQVKAKR